MRRLLMNDEINSSIWPETQQSMRKTSILRSVKRLRDIISCRCFKGILLCGRFYVYSNRGTLVKCNCLNCSVQRKMCARLYSFVIRLMSQSENRGIIVRYFIILFWNGSVIFTMDENGIEINSSKLPPVP